MNFIDARGWPWRYAAASYARGASWVVSKVPRLMRRSPVRISA
jgi:hypothetical protein